MAAGSFATVALAAALAAEQSAPPVANASPEALMTAGAFAPMVAALEQAVVGAPHS